MFTGLVEETGKVKKIQKTGEGKRITVSADKVLEDASTGDSINVSGACLTIEEYTEDTIKFFLAEETLEKTWFSKIKKDSKLNFERSLKAEDRMGGHQVQGHVEATAKVLEVQKLEQGWNMTFELPKKLSNYIIEKGFITVEGISLTTTEVTENSFSVTIIPETWETTNLSEKTRNNQVNLETDPTGRYIEKMLESHLQ